RVASSRTTSTGRAAPPTPSTLGRAKSTPATWTAGSWPCLSTIHPHVFARSASVVRASRRPVSPSPLSRSASSFSTRSIVVSEAPPVAPNNSTWVVIASMSDRQVAPAATVDAASASARPRSRIGTKPARETAPAKPAVRPVRSASSRGSTIPACPTVPGPPTRTDRPCDHPAALLLPDLWFLVFFTLRVLLTGGLADPDNQHFPKSGAPFHAPTPPEAKIIRPR